ncbi:hypothetical protein [Alteraurantiacibacter aquimixticola]|nr:hypothetical protein [Alteraurantiacibacter aquimixticola]
MTRFFENGIAAMAAIAIVAISFSAMVQVPADSAIVASAIALPVAA